MRNSTLSRVLSYIKKYRPLVILSAVIALITVGLTLLVPILIGDAIDLIVGVGKVDIAGVIRLLLIAGGAVILTAVLQWLMSMINNRITYHPFFSIVLKV